MGKQEITITLKVDDAEALKHLVQNPFPHETEGSEQVVEFRENIFNAIPSFETLHDLMRYDK